MDPAGYPLDGDDISTIPALTPWSVQAAMLSNMRRIVSGIVGDSVCGRPMQGLTMVKSGTKVTVNAGYGFTKNGNIISIGGAGITFDPGTTLRYIYLVHKMAVVDGLDTVNNPDGKHTGFVGKSGQEDIVYDDYAGSLKDRVQVGAETILIRSTSQIASIDDDERYNDLVYLGTVSTSETISNNIERGIPSKNEIITLQSVIINSLEVNGTATFNSGVEFFGAILIGNASDIGITTGSETLTAIHNDDHVIAPGYGATLKIRRGLIVGITDTPPP